MAKKKPGTKSKEPKTKGRTLRLSTQLDDRAISMEQATGISVPEIIRTALNEYLTKNNF